MVLGIGCAYWQTSLCLPSMRVCANSVLLCRQRNEYWRLKDAEGKPPGLVGWWPSRSVLFLENHDTVRCPDAGIMSISNAPILFRYASQPLQMHISGGFDWTCQLCISSGPHLRTGVDAGPLALPQPRPRAGCAVCRSSHVPCHAVVT